MKWHKWLLLYGLFGLILGSVAGCSRTIQVLPPTAPENTLSTGMVITGAVMTEDGHPISGATVRVKATETHASTGADGRFILTNLEKSRPVILTAWAPGYYIGGGSEKYLPGNSGIQFVLKKISGTDNPDYKWLSAFASAGEAGNCENCHANLHEPALPFSQWQGDAHALSAENVRFLSMYLGQDLQGNQSPPRQYGTNRDYGRVPLAPDLSKPYFGPGYKIDFPDTTGNCAACHVPASAIDDPYNADPTSVTGVGKEGITCDVCHKVWDVQLDSATGLPYPNMPGVMSIDFRRPAQDQQFFAGPFDDVAPGHDTYTLIQQQSQFCAACHFGVFWDTHVYNSFGEWFASPYSDPTTGKTCQDCHMPTGKDDHIARLDKGASIRDPQAIFSHRMTGASDVDLLQHAVSIVATAAEDNNQILVKVTVKNDQTGHDVPTDSPLRQVILVVAAHDPNGQDLTQLSGPTIPDWGGVGNPKDGYYAGLPGEIYAKTLMELWTGVIPTGAYWNPTRIVSDTRLAPFASDTSIFSFEIPAGGSAQIQVKLIYRRAFITLMDQKGWKVKDILMNQQNLTVSTK
jgi:hypothetical protein